jgi:hypothetical protein
MATPQTMEFGPDVGDTVASLDEGIRKNLAEYDGNVSAMFAFVDDLFAEIDRENDALWMRNGDDRRRWLRGSLELHRQAARIAGRRAVYGIANGADLPATGTISTAIIVGRVARLRLRQRHLRRLHGEVIWRLDKNVRGVAHLLRRRKRLERWLTQDHVAAFGDLLREERVSGDDSSRWAEEMRARFHQAESRRRKTSRREEFKMIRIVATPTVRFQAIRLAAFTVITTVFVKLVSLPFADLGLWGAVIAATVGYIGVQFVLTPLLRRRFEDSLKTDVLKLAYVEALVLAHAAIAEIRIAKVVSVLERMRESTA